jgi:purine-cytosine permease-like protein
MENQMENQSQDVEAFITFGRHTNRAASLLLATVFIKESIGLGLQISLVSQWIANMSSGISGLSVAPSYSLLITQVLVSGFMGALAWFGYRGLRNHQEWAWVLALGLCMITLWSLVFPLSLYTAWNLLSPLHRQKIRSKFKELNTDRSVHRGGADKKGGQLSPESEPSTPYSR